MVDAGLSVNGFFVAQISVVFASIQAGNVFSFVPGTSLLTPLRAADVER